MPTVPKVRLTADPTRPLPPVQLSTPAGNYATEGGAMGEAMARVGQQATQLGLQLLQQQQIRKRQILQLEVGTQLDQLEHLTLSAPLEADGDDGTDPVAQTRGGLLHKQGTAPMEQRDAYLEKFDLQTSEIAKAARTTEERVLVAQMIQTRRAQVIDRMDAHASGELAKYEYARMNASAASAVNRAATYADRPEVRQEALAEIERILRTHGPRFGIKGEILEQTIDQATAKAHAAIVNELLDGKFKNRRQARAYWESVRDSVQDVDARKAIQDKVDQGTTEQIAFDAVDEVMALLGPKTDNDAIQTDQIEAWLREKFKGDTDAAQVARAEARARLQGIESGRENRKAQLENPLINAVLDGQGSAGVRAMPEWVNASAQTHRFIAQMIDQRDARREAQREAVISRGREDERWRIQELERAEASKFAIEAQQTTLAEMDENAMLKKALEFQTERYQLLFRSAWLEVQRAKNGGQTVTLSEDDVKGVFGSSGYSWAAEGPPSTWGDDNRALYTAVMAAARAEIGRQQTGNKVLSLEEKNTIVKQILDNKVLVLGFVRPYEQVGVVVPAGDRAKAYVPLAKIPPPNLDASIKWFRENTPEGKASTNLTNEQLAKKYQLRFEHAYAAAMMGLGVEAQLTELRRDRARGRDAGAVPSGMGR
jgi:hypothetical protein